MSFVESIKSGKLIRGGILFVLAASPLPFGSVHIGVFYGIEIIIVALFMLWLIRIWLNRLDATTGVFEDAGFDEEEDARIHVRESRRRRHFSANQDRNHSSNYADDSLNVGVDGGESEDEHRRQHRQEKEDYHQSEDETRENPGSRRRRHKARSMVNPLVIVLGLIVLLVVFQMTSLPPKILKFISPITYQMYSADLPDATSIRETEGLSKAMTANSKKELEGEPASQEMKNTISNAPKREGGLEQKQSEEPWRSLSFNHQATKLVFYKILAYILICFLTIQNLDRYEQARNMIQLLIYMGVFQAAYGIIDALSGHNYIFSFYKTAYQGMATGTFINRNHLAGYLEMIIPLAFGYFLHQLEKQRVERRENWRQKIFSLETVFSKYAFLLFLVVIMAIAILFSQSRMGITGLMASLAFMGLALSWHNRKGHVKIFLVVVGVALLLAIVSGLDEIMKRFEDISTEMAAEVSRSSLWRDSLKIFQDYPLFGVGSGNYASLFPKYKAWQDSYFYDHAHNDYVEMLVESGLVGMGIFLIGVVYFAFVGLRFLIKERENSRWTVVLGGLAGLLAISLHGITDFNMQIPANAMMFFFLLGLTYRIMAGRLGGEEAGRRRRRRKRKQ